MSDIDHILDRLRGLIGDQDPDQIVAFVHEGAPASKARARWNGKSRSFYTPSDSRNAQDALSWKFKAAMGSGARPFLGPVAIVAMFFRPNFQRIDVDNMMKLVMDAATKAGVWKDDCQVSAQAALSELDRVHPRTVIALCPYISSLTRAPLELTCAECGIKYHRTALAEKRRLQRPSATVDKSYCSVACAQKQSRALVKCARCGTQFTRQRPGQRYCSMACVNADPAVRQKRAEQRPAPKCTVCGGRVSRREYLRCANCSPKGRKIGSKNKPTASIEAPQEGEDNT